MQLEVCTGLCRIRAFVPLLEFIKQKLCLVYYSVELYHDIRVRYWVSCIHGKLLHILYVLNIIVKASNQILLTLEPLLVIVYHELVYQEFLDIFLQHVLCAHQLKLPIMVLDIGQCPPQEHILNMLLGGCFQVLSLYPLAKGFVILIEGVPRYYGSCSHCNNHRRYRIWDDGKVLP